MTMTCTVQRLLPLPPARSPRLEEARDFAGRNYAGQRRGSPERYEAHLKAVEATARHFGLPVDIGVDAEDFLVACWLHDAIEGTSIPISRVRDAFGDDVATIVTAVSDMPGETRRARQAATYPQVVASPVALRIKILDRIANIEVAMETQEWEILACYRREAVSFRAALYTQGANQVLWAHLDALYDALDRFKGTA